MISPIVIALSGKKGSGKNTISKFARDYFGQRWYKGVRNGVDFCIECAFADLLKHFCITVLGLKHEQCYGTNDDKNSPTKYRWENTPLRFQRHGFMTARDVMQIFGTECVRQWFGNVWAEATLQHINEKHPALAIITDTRFPNEIETVLQHGGYVIRLTRSPFKDDLHPSEISLDKFNWNCERCFLLDNASMSKEEQNQEIIPILDQIFRQELEK